MERPQEERKIKIDNRSFANKEISFLWQYDANRSHRLGFVLSGGSGTLLQDREPTPLRTECPTGIFLLPGAFWSNGSALGEVLKSKCFSERAGAKSLNRFIEFHSR